MSEQQHPFANFRRIMASLLTMTIALGPSVTPAFASSAKPATAHAGSATATPIQHLVVIFNENISFDHYFGTYPNAHNPSGEPKFVAAPGTPTVNGLTNALLNNNPNLNPANGTSAANPFRLDRSQAFTNDMDHDYMPEQQASDNGLMDLFPLYTGSAGPPPSGMGASQTNGLVMGYFDGNTVTAMWNYAQHFGLSDNSYGTTFGPSLGRCDEPGFRPDQWRGRLSERNWEFCARWSRRFADQHRRSRSDRRCLLQPDSQPGANGRRDHRRSADLRRRELGRVHGRVQSVDRERERNHRLQAQHDLGRHRSHGRRLHPAPFVVRVLAFRRKLKSHPSRFAGRNRA